MTARDAVSWPAGSSRGFPQSWISLSAFIRQLSKNHKIPTGAAPGNVKLLASASAQAGRPFLVLCIPSCNFASLSAAACGRVSDNRSHSRMYQMGANHLDFDRLPLWSHEFYPSVEQIVASGSRSHALPHLPPFLAIL